MMLADGLYAGFLLLGHAIPRKQYVAFEFELEDNRPPYKPIFKRHCSSAEKRELKKQVFGLRIVQSIPLKTKSGDRCLLFTRK